MARPKLSDEDKRDYLLGARVTLGQRARVKENARKAGLSVADFVRARSLEHQIHPPKSRLDNEAIAVLNRLAVQYAGACNNANQLTRAEHRGSDFRHYWQEVGAELTSTHEQIKAALERLLVTIEDDEA